MNSQEAYKILELSPGASAEEIKRSFKRLALKYHPDKNKDNQDAEDKFKKINSAYQLLTNPKAEASEDPGNWQDIFKQHFGGMPFNMRNHALHPVRLPNVIIPITLSFVESVVGCTKDVVADQYVHCSDCNGTGCFLLADTCKHCNGNGSVQANFTRGNVIFMQPCGHCTGTGKNLQKCETCTGKGYLSKNGPLNLTIPGGLVDGCILQGPGAMLNITVVPDDNMTLEEGNVVSNLNLSLLEAIKGTKRKVPTIKGEMNLKVPANIKNKDQITVHGYGVPRVNGSHIFNVKVHYPENTDKLIEFLENEK